MKKNDQAQTLAMTVLIMVGAGLASALLDIVSEQQRYTAFLLGYLMPLPLMIAALGFGRVAGAGAGLVSTLAVGGLLASNVFRSMTPTSPEGALIEMAVFAVVAAIPAWCLSVLAGRRPAVAAGEPQVWAAPSPPPLPSYPLATLIVLALVFAVGTEIVALLVSAARHGGYENDIATKAARLVPTFERLLGSEVALPGGLDVASIASIFQRAVPSFDAIMRLLMYAANLWLAGRVIQVSSRLGATWPDIARDLRLPRWLALMLAVAIATCFAPGLAGAIALLTASAIAAAFALQGLAVVHAVTRGATFRVPLLCLVYLLLAFLMPWPLALFSIVGLVDSGFPLRERRASKSSNKA